MKEDRSLKKLEKILKIWLAKNQLDSDLLFYRIEEWRERKEPYLNTSELVIVFEGELQFLLNYNYGSELSDEFEDLVGSFGYYYEMGHSWNLGFYKIPDWDFAENIDSNYSNKLKDHRWKSKSKFIKERAKFICEDCEVKKSQLEVHHCYYLYGFEPWEYPYDSLRCLCRECHEDRGRVEFEFRSFLASLKGTEIELLQKGLESGMYWFDRKELFSMLGGIDSSFSLLKKKGLDV